jgi:hypothetical protein
MITPFIWVGDLKCLNYQKAYMKSSHVGNYKNMGRKSIDTPVNLFYLFSGRHGGLPCAIADISKGRPPGRPG